MTTTTWAYILGGITLLALFQKSVHTLLTAVFEAVLHVFNALRAWLLEAAGSLRATRARLLEDIGVRDGRLPFSLLIGAAAAAAAALLLSGCESTMVIYAMQSLFGETLALQLPPIVQNVQGLLTGGLIVAGLYAAWAYKALAPDSRTHLLVLDWYGPSARKLLRRCAGAAALAILVSVVGLAVVRSAGLDEAERVEAVEQHAPIVPSDPEQVTAPSTYERVVHVARWVVGISSAAAYLMAGVPAFAIALDGVQFVAPVAVAWALAFLALVRWLASAVAGVIAGLRLLVTLLLHAVAWVGNPLARSLVELLRRLHGWAEERPDSRGLARAWRGLIASLTALGDDLQVPDASERPWAETPARRTRQLA